MFSLGVVGGAFSNILVPQHKPCLPMLTVVTNDYAHRKRQAPVY